MKILSRLSPLLLIPAFSFLVHLPGITSPLLDYHAHRQCQTASMARNYARRGMHFFHPEIDTEGIPVRAGTEFPLYSFLLAVLFKLGGIHEALGRVLSALFAAGGALYLYALVRRRLSESIAWVSALVMCVVPVHIYFTRTVQPEPMALWAFLGFLFHWDRWSSAGSTKHFIAAILLGALGPLLKLPFLYLVIPMGTCLWYEHRSVTSFRSFFVLLAGIGGLTAAWYAYARTAPVAVLPLSTQDHWQNLRPLLTRRLWEAHFISRFPELCTTYSGLLLGIVGAWQLRKKRFFIYWFLATVLYIVLLGEYGLIHRYTELPFAPITSVFMSAGIVALWDRTQQSRWGRVALIVLIVGIPVHAALRIKHWYNLERMWLFRARDVVARVTRPEDLVLTNTAEHPVLLYYIDRYGFAADLKEDGLPALGKAQARGARFFLTPTEGAWSLHPEWAASLSKTARLIKQDPEYLLYRFPDPKIP